MTSAQPPSVRTTIGETFDIRLEAVPTSGYIWELDPRGLPGEVKLVSAETIPARGQVAGGPAIQIFRFRATRAGDLRIRFRYRRRWEPEPIREMEISVAIATA